MGLLEQSIKIPDMPKFPEPIFRLRQIKSLREVYA